MIRELIHKVIERKHRQQFFAADTKNTFDLSRRDIKRAHQLGFIADEYAFYDLAHNDPGEYISEYERMQFRDKIRDYRIVFDNKVLFYSIIRNFANVNPIYAYKFNGIFVNLEEGISENGLVTLLEHETKLVVKLNDCGGGEGFKLLRFMDGKYFVNQLEYTRADFTKYLAEMDNYLIEKFCTQSDFENQLFPYSVNTLRIITGQSKDGHLEILGATHRFGFAKDSFADNACQGGLFASVDVNTGILSYAYSRGKDALHDEGHRIKKYKSHPTTGSQIEGVKIPNWKDLCENMLLLQKKLEFIGAKFIAWDIALTDQGFCIIEANSSCDFRLFQSERGGVRNNKIGNFFKSYHYIK